ncbi:Na+/H+ antiporter NhaC family protein [Cellulomonas sp. NPDC089187]|uniref:Na+/H+ antiporter NhaC family protein n=1 Tax=Cellulomonas sp. NPDC089187 TaxID=3154970 RepID=UPI003443CCB8
MTSVRTVAPAAVGLVASLVAGLLTAPPSIWGLLPIVLFTVLVVLGAPMLRAGLVALASALLVLLPGPSAVWEIVRTSIPNQVTIIGLVIVLGAAVGEVLRRTGVAAALVRGIVGLVGDRGRTATALAIMLSCLVLVAALGTLAGALAIAAPLVIPVAARLGFTRSATASMMFAGGGAGLALAPFAGSNVAVMTAAGAGYPEYLVYGALPLAAVSVLVGLPVALWMQRRTDDVYGPEDAAGDASVTTLRTRAATWTFLVLLVGSVVGAVVVDAGLFFPVVALPVLGVVTGLIGGLGGSTVRALGTGAWSMRGMFLLFLLLAVLFVTVDLIAPFDVVIDRWGDSIGALGPFLFAVVVALLGWVGVPGATAAQVVLLNELFGGLAGQIGIGAGTWIIVLLFASKADTYGPFPNPNMVGAMGLARSTNLRGMLLTGWSLLVPACCVYLLLMFLETR